MRRLLAPLLVLLPVIAIAVVLTVGWWSFRELERSGRALVDARITPLVERDIPAVESAHHAVEMLLETDRDLFRTLLTEKAALIAGDEELTALDRQHQELITAIEARLGKVAPLLGGAASGLDPVRQALAAWKEKTRRVIELCKDPRKLAFARRISNGGSAEEAFTALRSAMAGLVDSIQASTDRLVDETERAGAAARSEAVGASERANRATLVFLACGLAAAAITLVQLVLARRATGRALADAAGRQRESEALAARLGTLLQDLGRRADGLAESAQGLDRAANTLAATTEENASRTASASAAAEQVSTGVRTIAASTEEMNSSIGEIARSTSEAASTARTAAEASRRTGETVRHLERSSQEVGRVVATIAAIAEQTNLLALNAAIEAASAGEAGRGFAVVAAEVKNLANQAAEATRSIGQILAGIQQETRQVVAGTDELAGVVASIDAALATIAAAVEEQSATVKEMARTAGESADGTGEIAGALSELAAGAKAAAEEVARVREAAATVAGLSDGLRSGARAAAG